MDGIEMLMRKVIDDGIKEVNDDRMYIDERFHHYSERVSMKWKEYLDIVFGGIKCERGVTAYEIFKEICTTKQVEFKRLMDEYLVDCYPVLKRFWSIKKRNKDIDAAQIFDDLKQVVPYMFVKSYFDDWGTNEIIEKTIKIMESY